VPASFPSRVLSNFNNHKTVTFLKYLTTQLPDKKQLPRKKTNTRHKKQLPDKKTSTRQKNKQDKKLLPGTKPTTRHKKQLPETNNQRHTTNNQKQIQKTTRQIIQNYKLGQNQKKKKKQTKKQLPDNQTKQNELPGKETI